MRRIALAAALALAACSSTPEPEAAPPPATAPPSASAPPAQTPTPQPTADQCGAKDLQRLIGRPRTEAPVPVRPELQRVVCSTCAMTMDYVPNRLNVIFDATTGLIKEVRCG